MSKGHLAIGSHGAIDTAATTVTSTRTASLRSVTGKPFAVADEADEALNAGAVAAAELRGKGQKPHQQAIAAADAATRAAKAAGRPFEQVAFASAKAAALAVQTAGGSLQQGCVEAGRAASYAAKSEQTVAIPAASSNAAFSALRSMGLPDGQMTECLALAVKTACKANGTQPESLAECAGSTAMAAAQHAGMTEDEQAEVAGKAVQVITVVTDSPEPEAVETTENPELQVLIREVEEAKKAAQDAAIAAGMAHVEAEKAKAEAKVSTTTSPPTTTVPSNATFETEVIVTEAPKPASATAAPSITTPAAQTRRPCPDSTRAPRGTWVVYNLSATPILHSCLVRSIKDRVPDECCSANGAENMVGATFQELYYSNEYGTCPTLTFAGPLAGTRVKLQCNFDNTITYGESRCGADCSCAFEDVYGPGCYRASDALPGTAWFFMTAGCDCTDAKAVQPHQFSLPPLDQNVRAGDILNVGPEEAAKAMNRQRQQLRTFHDEMVKDEQVLAGVVGKLSSGKPIADAIFGMDTGELPEQATKRMLEVATQDPATAKYAINATVSIMGHALSTLKSGKPLADAVFGGDTSHLIQPHLLQNPMAHGPGQPTGEQDFSLPLSSFGGKLPDFHSEATGQPVVETVRFAGEFKAIIGDNVQQFLQECSEKLKPVSCKDAQPGSVLVTLSAANWADLHTADALIDQGGFELPSFGKFEKEQETSKAGPKSAKEAFDAAAEKTPEETKADLLNPDMTANDVKIVQSIFDKVHEEEEKEAEDGKPAKGSAQEASAAAVPTAEERSAGDVIVGVFLLLFGFGCVGFCVYYWSAASKRVKQRLQTAASKRLMKRGKEGDTQLYVTSIEGLQAGEQVVLGKETVTVESVAFVVTISDGLADACKSGDAVVKTPDSESADQKPALVKDAAAGDKELVVSSALVAKKGDRLKIGAAAQELTVKSVAKTVTVTPELKTAHAIGTKLRKPGEPEKDADKDEAAAETAEETAEGDETAEEKRQDLPPASSQN